MTEFKTKGRQQKEGKEKIRVFVRATFFCPSLHCNCMTICTSGISRCFKSLSGADRDQLTCESQLVYGCKVLNVTLNSQKLGATSQENIPLVRHLSFSVSEYLANELQIVAAFPFDIARHSHGQRAPQRVSTF